MNLPDQRARQDRSQIDSVESATRGRVLRPIQRFVIRTLRILFGSLLLSLAYWSAEVGMQQWSIPWAAQSTLGMIGAVVLTALTLYLVIIAISTAFGSGPRKIDK